MHLAFIDQSELSHGIVEGFLGDDVDGWYCEKNGAGCVLYQEDDGWTWYANEKNGDLSTSIRYFETKEDALADFNANVDTGA